LDVDAARQVEAHQRVDGLRRRIDDIDQPFVRTHFELFAGILVFVHRAQDRDDLPLRRQRDRSRNAGAGTLGGLHDFLGRLVQNPMIVRFQTNANLLLGHEMFPPSVAQFEIGHTPREFPDDGGLHHDKGAGCIGNLPHHRIVTDQRSQLYKKSDGKATVFWAAGRPGGGVGTAGPGGAPRRTRDGPAKNGETRLMQPGFRIVRFVCDRVSSKYYFSMEATVPAPTVRPPSRIAKRVPTSMAIGAISSTVTVTLSRSEE